MGKNTFVYALYEGCSSYEWKVGRLRQGSFTTGIPFKFYLNEVFTDLADLPLGCEPSGNIVRFFLQMILHY